MSKEQKKALIIEVIKTIFDPEIPVNIWELGLIYEIDFYEENEVRLVMTLTAPNCPMADAIVEEVNNKIEAIDGIDDVTVVLTFEPEWNQDMMSDEAKLELGFL